MTPGIEATGLRRSFADVRAVRDVSLQALPGRVTALVGPNGSGKTTLLLMLASLLRPDAGQIRLGGVDPVADPRGARALLGWMPDALGAWPSLTVRETLHTTGRLYRLSRADAAGRAEQLIAELALEDLADAPARVLSRGQKQRLGLARALVHDPSVLLLDEPASGLDPRARIELRHLLRRLAAEGRTVLVSSHVLAELDEVADDAVFLQNGETVGAERLARAARRMRDWRVRLVTASDADPDADPRLPILTVLDDHDPAGVRRDRRDVLVPFASETEAAQSLARLVAAGLPIAEFAPATGELEHTFLDLGEPDDAPGRPGGDPGRTDTGPGAARDPGDTAGPGAATPGEATR
ncbi:ABC transporter ATP-binding protein [Microbacterium sp. LRZ72]|uniref:ABC transporter ATP-binding protein n=1 Tax=Microbacterium sp. LRZ72 TaxID=2942481 RepID=UPI0029B54757|nr:ABC transporter ATP-binding protein [Microbacterium sp. LRZ72]MDX2377249.1 ABC transporter ATP-binding protein [Microbacterium sp. LRZ72]